jgi:hypothetical protein
MRVPAAFVALVLSLALFLFAWAAEDRVADGKAVTRSSAMPREEANTMKIRLQIDGKAITATLADNATARDFVALLPLTLTLEDYASTEKIAYLPRKLSTAGAPAGFDPSTGDITYYAPWGNLAIFHKDFDYSEGLVHLGRIEDGIDALKVRGALKVTIEAIDK